MQPLRANSVLRRRLPLPTHEVPLRTAVALSDPIQVLVMEEPGAYTSTQVPQLLKRALRGVKAGAGRGVHQALRPIG